MEGELDQIKQTPLAHSRLPRILAGLGHGVGESHVHEWSTKILHATLKGHKLLLDFLFLGI
jgi:hypothetical protein